MRFTWCLVLAWLIFAKLKILKLGWISGALIMATTVKLTVNVFEELAQVDQVARIVVDARIAAHSSVATSARKFSLRTART
jgi:hypothetical protein